MTTAGATRFTTGAKVSWICSREAGTAPGGGSRRFSARGRGGDTGQRGGDAGHGLGKHGIGRDARKKNNSGGGKGDDAVSGVGLSKEKGAILLSPPI